MSRSRNIKPGFFANDRLAECSPLARLLFAGLWTIADREGRLEDRPKRIKAEVLPYDDCDIESLLCELANGGFIARYTVEKAKYIQVIAFKKHQNPHKNEADSVIPPMESEEAQYKHHTSTVQAPEQHSTNPADSLNLIPDSGFLIPDPLVVENSTRVENDDESHFREMLDKQRQEQDERVRFLMTAEWTPDSKILNSHLRTSGSLGMANGKPVTFDDLTDEILDSFKASAFRKQERRTKHDWHGGLARYLANSLKNGPKPENVYPMQSKPDQENKPKGDGSLWYCSQPLPKRPPRAERTDEEIAELIAKGRKAMEAAR